LGQRGAWYRRCMSEAVLLVSDEGSVRVLCLNRPGSKNSLDRELVQALGDALEGTEAEPAFRAVVLTGAGGAFCSGIDLRSAREDLGSPERLAERLEAFHRLIRILARMPQPVIAAVDGPAVGFGADLAFACDLRIATSQAYFEEKFVGLGLMPDGGGTFHLPRLIGVGRALEMLMLGARLDAESALELGVVNRVVEPDGLLETARGLARKLAEGPPLALARIKRAVREGLEGSLDQALERERLGQLALLATEDLKEGVTAFFEKRPPRFRGV
jgi:2-(1,2-epoxy-1,2-dihydrophenyl)acetyl-CoA isomerase